MQYSMTDPGGKGTHIFLGHTGAAICPVVAVLSYCAVRPSSPITAPLFIQQDGSFLSRSSFVQEVRSALRSAGIDHSLYAGHSFRIGAATTAALAGVPDHLIKALGRWHSDAFQLYTRTPQATLASVAPVIASLPQSQ